MFAICHIRTGAASQVVAIHAAQQLTYINSTNSFNTNGIPFYAGAYVIMSKLEHQREA